MWWYTLQQIQNNLFILAKLIRSNLNIWENIIIFNCWHNVFLFNLSTYKSNYIHNLKCNIYKIVLKFKFFFRILIISLDQLEHLERLKKNTYQILFHECIKQRQKVPNISIITLRKKYNTMYRQSLHQKYTLFYLNLHWQKFTLMVQMIQ